MPNFSKQSIDKLHTCERRLIQLCSEVIKTHDIRVLCGHRGREEQEEAFKNGTSKAKWGQSKHNSRPSMAVDIAPYPIDWADIDGFKKLGEFVKKKADEMGIKIKWGGDFTNLKDYPHFELDES